MMEKDIFTYGYNKYLYKQIPVVESPLVYNQIEDRMSLLMPAGQQVTNVVQNLPTEETST